MHIDKFKKEDGHYEDEEGCYYETAEDYLQTKVLKFCACGNPENNLQFIRKALQYIEDLQQVWDKKKTYEEWKEEGLKLFGSEEAGDFIFYVFDEKELTEHGSSIPGWLTEKGRDLLEDIDELYTGAKKGIVV